MSQTSEITIYGRLYDEKFNEIAQLLDDLPAAALLWKPFESSPWQGPAGSLGWLVAHALSSTWYLLRRAEWTLGRRDWDSVDGDEGAEEFGPANHDPAYLRARAERAQEFTRRYLEGLVDADLAASRPHPLDPQRQLTVRYDTMHALEHLSQHIGHAQLTRQLWALQRP